MKEVDLEHMSLFMQSFILDAIRDKLVSFPNNNSTLYFEEWIKNWLAKHEKGKEND